MGSSRPPIRILELAGSPTQMGATHGAEFADEIRTYADERIALVCQGTWSGGPMTRGEVLEIAESMVDAHERFDADLHAEMAALADAAGITIGEAIVVGGFTDFVDTVRAVVGGATPAEVVEDDCTAVIVPDSRADGAGLLAQTWDMHDSATDHVLLLRIEPDDAPGARVFTTTGCLGQIGMNSEGVCVGINNLTARDGTAGVAWTSVVRAMLKASTAADALDLLLDADLAGAHNYLLFDRHGDGFSVEAMPSVRHTTRLGSEVLAHTNHTIHADTTAVQVERNPIQQTGSIARLERAGELLADGLIDPARLMSLTADPEAICQLATEPFHIESSGAAVMRPSTGEFWACWGRPADNEFERIETTAPSAAGRS